MMNQNVCRCCLKENSAQTYKIFADSSSLWEDLRLCLPPALTYEYNDGLTQIICDSCWRQIHQFRDFQRQCLLADQELRRRYADYKNQAVEEVLSLIEKLRQEDSTNGTDKDLSNAYEGGLRDLVAGNDASEYSHLSSDFDIYSPSHDSGIFEEDFSSQSSCSFGCVLQNEVEQRSSPLYSPASSKSSESESCKKRRSYKGPFACKYCDKKFTRNFQLKLHLISIHQVGDGLQYTCHLCSKTFASNHSLSYHRKSVHYQQKPHFCPMCDRQFVLKSQLISHMRTHTGETKPRIFDCPECGKRWPTKSDLRTHMRSHDPNMERPFKCDRCEKSFFTRGHLTSHQLVHTGEKPFVCEFCKRSYQSVGNLNNHMTRRHIKEMVLKEENSLEVYASSNAEMAHGEMVLMEA